METLDIALLRQLCALPGIAGREDRVRAVVAETLRPLVNELRIDALGNLVATKRGDGPRVMIAAHLDEIGFIVSHIDDHGFLRLQPVGGFDPRALVAQRVLVHGFAGSELHGALQPGIKPFHLLERDEIKPPKLEELFVNVGLPVERVRAEVELGDLVTLDRELVEAGDGVMSKALDDRVGVFVMIEALRAMKQSNAEVVAVATTQEEVGLRRRRDGGLRGAARCRDRARCHPGARCAGDAIRAGGDALRGRCGDQTHGQLAHCQPGSGAAPARPGRSRGHSVSTRSAPSRRHGRGRDAAVRGGGRGGHALDPHALRTHGERVGRPVRYRRHDSIAGALSGRRRVTLVRIRAVGSREAGWRGGGVAGRRGTRGTRGGREGND